MCQSLPLVPQTGKPVLVLVGVKLVLTGVVGDGEGVDEDVMSWAWLGAIKLSAVTRKRNKASVTVKRGMLDVEQVRTFFFSGWTELIYQRDLASRSR